MFDKKEFLLHSIIKAYLENREPISSNGLKSMYDISFSPATIRGYFKKLCDEGYLAQEHISSGRTPTTEALKEYWTKRLKFNLTNIDYDQLVNLATSMELTVFIRQQTTDTLHRILNVENVYMILEFYKTKLLGQSVNKFPLTTQCDSYAVTIEFNNAFYKFLTDMKDRTFDDILEISSQVGANHLHMELSKYVQNNIFEIINIKKFLQLAVQCDLDEKNVNLFLQGDVMLKLKQGIYLDGLLPQGQIAICHDTKVHGTDIKILVVGSLSSDFEYFYNNISL
ncbi:Heat-inducible transcription repressor HrcA [hydrothermal vent metagenome]|uniref:Heat-inducible transcription repressor HrcA n=1 Tax=hydrothermal vent metagenome TaxID=652676 RepID=A0A3B1E6L6_9ZZZZ